MNTAAMEREIYVNTGGGYKVTVGAGLIDRCGELLRPVLTGDTVMLITDTSVAPLYLKRATSSLTNAGFRVVPYVIPAGETSKNMAVITSLLELFANSGLTRSDAVVSLGGGVVGDTAGFAAGVYMRGVAFVQIPTTLLASVDASVGGKTGVDLSAGKNLAGVFHQPKTVLCDVLCLDTLPSEVFADGVAEVIKTGILSGEELFSHCESRIDKSDNIISIIEKCVIYKAKIVEEDERDSGRRKLLNLGHTVGHAIERLSGYTTSHGYAVARGIAVISRAAAALGQLGATELDRIISALEANSLPTTTEYTATELAAAATSDKKRKGGTLTLVMPRGIGDCVLIDYPVDELEGIFSLGLGGESTSAGTSTGAL
ncbi:MAG: 3-dehydroquinate synthase [Eubacteriales bacterium]